MLNSNAIEFVWCSSDCCLLRLKSEGGMQNVFKPAMCQGLSVPSRSYRCLKPKSLLWMHSSLVFNFIWKLTVAYLVETFYAMYRIWCFTTMLTADLQDHINPLHTVISGVVYDLFVTCRQWINRLSNFRETGCESSL